MEKQVNQENSFELFNEAFLRSKNSCLWFQNITIQNYRSNLSHLQDGALSSWKLVLNKK